MAFTYGWCDYCPFFTYHDLTNGACGDRLARWREFPQTAPAWVKTRARHCEQAQAGYFYCEATVDDPCGPGRHPHDGHAAGQCA